MRLLRNKIALMLLIAVFTVATLLYAAKPKLIVTDKELDAYFAEMIPKVEAITGKKFQEIPRYGLLTETQAKNYFSSKWYAQNKNKLKSLSSKEIKALKEEYIQTEGKGEFGVCWQYKYEQWVALFPGNIKRYCIAAKLTQKQTKVFVKLVIAHELTHAIQNEVVGVRTPDNRQVGQPGYISYVIREIHARFVAQKVSESIGARGVLETIDNLPPDNYATLDITDKYGADQSIRYNQLLLKHGKDFFEWQYNHGGNGRVWQVLSNPPKNLSEITHPETYGQSVKETVDYATILAGLEKRFIDKNWPVENIERSEIEMRSAFVEMNSDTQNKILANLEHAQKLDTHDTKTDVTMRLYVFKDPAVAQLLLKELERLYVEELQAMKTSKTCTATNVKQDDFNCVTSDLGRKVTSTLVLAHGKTNDIAVWVARDKYLVQIGLSDIKSSDEHIGEVIEEIFSRLDKAKAVQK